MLLRHDHAGPLSVLLSIFDRGGDRTSAWSKDWPVLPPLLLLLLSTLSPPHVALRQSHSIGGWPSMGNENADSSVSREITVQVWLLCGSSAAFFAPPVLHVFSGSRPLLDASFQEIIDNGQSTAARGGAEESGDRCPHLQPCHETSLSNYSIKTRVWYCGGQKNVLHCCLVMWDKKVKGFCPLTQR